MPENRGPLGVFKPGLLQSLRARKTERKHTGRWRGGRPAKKPDAGEDEEEPMPYFIVGDNAFPMNKFLQKPYPQRRADKKKEKLQLQAEQSTKNSGKCVWNLGIICL